MQTLLEKKVQIWLHIDLFTNVQCLPLQILYYRALLHYFTLQSNIIREGVFKDMARLIIDIFRPKSANA